MVAQWDHEYNLTQATTVPSKEDVLQQTLCHQLQPNTLSNAFFSSQNMQVLQETILRRIFNETGKRISKQSENELLIIMRSIYIQESRNLEENITQQVMELNKSVIRYAVPIIITNMKQDEGYLIDASRPLMPMSRSVNLSSAGTRSLELKEF